MCDKKSVAIFVFLIHNGLKWMGHHKMPANMWAAIAVINFFYKSILPQIIPFFSRRMLSPAKLNRIHIAFQRKMSHDYCVTNSQSNYLASFSMPGQTQIRSKHMFEKKNRNHFAFFVPLFWMENINGNVRNCAKLHVEPWKKGMANTHVQSH